MRPTALMHPDANVALLSCMRTVCPAGRLVLRSHSQPVDLPRDSLFADPAWAIQEGSNFVDPPYVDTVTMTEYSWVRLRFVADNPGMWHFHCHFQYHMMQGLQTVFNVAEELQPNPCAPPFVRPTPCHVGSCSPVGPDAWAAHGPLDPTLPRIKESAPPACTSSPQRRPPFADCRYASWWRAATYDMFDGSRSRPRRRKEQASEGARNRQATAESNAEQRGG